MINLIKRLFKNKKNKKYDFPDRAMSFEQQERNILKQARMLTEEDKEKLIRLQMDATIKRGK